MVEKSELLRVPSFADLPDDQIAWFLSQAQELHYKAGDTYLRQGTPADSMFVILEGQLELHGDLGGETVAFSLQTGDVTGSASVFQDEAIYGEWPRNYRQPRPAFSRCTLSRSRAEDAGVG
jgi:CRP-like cAMP-binding protein